MAATIYSVPEEINVPEINFSNFNRTEYEKKCKQFEKDCITYLNDLGYAGKNVGEIISFPVADGKARYMVISMRPLQLLHLPLDDAWEFEYVNNLTSKDVQEKINQRIALEKMFSK
jgi:hypothetical protein